MRKKSKRFLKSIGAILLLFSLVLAPLFSTSLDFLNALENEITLLQSNWNNFLTDFHEQGMEYKELKIDIDLMKNYSQDTKIELAILKTDIENLKQVPTQLQIQYNGLEDLLQQREKELRKQRTSTKILGVALAILAGTTIFLLVK